MPTTSRSEQTPKGIEVFQLGTTSGHIGEKTPIFAKTRTYNHKNIQPPPGLSAINVFNSMKAMYSITKRYAAVLTVTCSVMMFGIGLLTPVQAQDPQPYLPKVSGTIRNCAEVSASTTTDPDSTPGNYNDSGTDAATSNEEDDNACINVPAFDLAIRKLLTSAATMLPGGNATFSITVYNQGAFDATSVIVTDYIDPAKFDCTASAALPNTGWTFDCASNRATYTIPTVAKAVAADMPTGKAATPISITLKTLGTASGSATNDSEISSATGGTDIDSAPDQNTSNDGTTKDDVLSESRLTPTGTVADPAADEDDRDPASVSFMQPFDLALIKTLKAGQGPTFQSGGSVTFTITITNQGGTDATNVQVTDYIPTGLTLNDPAWSASSGKATLQTPIPSLAAGGSTTRDITFTIDAGATGTIRNIAEISSATGGTDIDSTPDATNGNQPGEVEPVAKNDVVTENGTTGGDEDDHDWAEITLTPIYDLALIKTLAVGQSSTVTQGSTVDYVITVKNQGQVPSGTFVVTEQIPGGMSFVSASGSGFICGTPNLAGAVSCAHAAGIAIGATATINLRLQLDDATKGPFRNWAEISVDSGDDRDSTPDSNTGKDDLTGTGTDPNDLVNNHNNIDYTGNDDEDDNDYEDIAGTQVYDLALRKTLAAGQANPVNQGDNVDYVVTVFNQGSAPSGTFSVTDQIPSGMQYVNATGTGFACAPSGQVLTCNFLNSLAAGNTAQINVRVRVTDATQSIMRNWAEISLDSGDDVDSTPDTNTGIDNAAGTGTDPNDGSVSGGTVKDDVINEDHLTNPTQDEDDNDYADLTVNPVFDLALKKTLATGQAATVFPGDNVTFTITITNQGQAPATNIQVTDYIPTGMTLNDPSWTAAGTNATRTIAGPLAAGASTTVDIILRVGAAVPTGPLTNYAEISAATGGTDIDSTPDTNPSNDPGGVPNSATDDKVDGNATSNPADEDDHDPAQINVAPPQIFDLALKKTLATGQAATIAAGDNVTFTITVYNQGSVTAQNIQITDYIPAGMQLNDTDWTAAGANATITIPGPLAMGASTTVDITLRVLPTATAGQLVNLAEISSAQKTDGTPGVDVDSTPDTNPTNDRGGQVGTLTDDKIDDNKVVSDPTKVDEDDHDPAAINVVTLSLGNRVWYDLNNNGIIDPTESGISNVMVSLFRDTNRDGTPDGAAISTTTTNAEGYYIFTALTPDTYVVEIMPPTGYTSSTVDGGDPDNDIDSDDNGVVLIGGKYRSLPVDVLLNSEPTGDLLGTVVDTTPDNNSNYTVDFGLWQPVSLGNRVWNDVNNDGINQPAETGVSGVMVNLYKDSNKDETPDSTTPVASTTTNADGYYLFTNLLEDTYIVEIMLPTGYTSSSVDAGDPDTDRDDLDDNGTVVSGNKVRATNVMVMAGTQPTGEPATPGITDATPDANANYTVDFGIWKPMSLGNLVWYDVNNNGAVDPGENGASGVTVRLYRDTDKNGTPDGAALATQTTNSTGYYLFTNLLADSYMVEVVAPTGYVSSTPDAVNPNTDTDDNDDNGIGAAGGNIRSGTLMLMTDATPTGEPATPGYTDSSSDNNANYTLDFGLYRPSLSLGNRVWYDENNNGLNDPSEVGIPNVMVTLFRDSNNDGTPDGGAVNAVLTNTDGYYLFTDLAPDTYIVEVMPPTGYISSTVDAGDPDTDADDADDNGVLLVAGKVRSNPITLATDAEPQGEPATPGWADAVTDRNANYTVDFGFYSPLSLGNRVWYDRNNNGIDDPTEVGVSNVTVRLYADANNDGTPDGAAIGTTTTNTQGYYLFKDLLPNTYIVDITAPAGYVSSTPDAGDPDSDRDDLDDNGVGTAGGVIISKSVTLSGGTQPVGEPATPAIGDTTPDANANYTLDFGIWQPMSLGNLVWEDTNNNGLKEGSENGIGNVTVYLYKDSDKDESPDSPTPIAQATTNGQGFYLFTNLPEDTYIVEIVPPSGYSSSTVDAGDPDTDADDGDDNGVILTNGRIRSFNVMLMPGTEPTGEGATTGWTDTTPDANANYTVDFGLWRAMSLGNRVWNDPNNNGIEDAGEAGVANVPVNLFRDTNNDGAPDGAAIKNMTTNAQGYYLFTDLTPDTYIVEIVAPSGYVSSAPDAGDADTDADDLDDNGVGNGGGAIRSLPVTLVINSEPVGELPTPGLTDTVSDLNGNYTVDFGIYQPVSLGNHVWEDRNNNGVKDGTEPGMANIPVRLYKDSNNDGNPDGPAIATMNTNAQGFYLFKDIGADTYIVEIVMPPNYRSSTVDAGDPDSDRDDMDDNGTVLIGTATVRAQPVTLTPGGQPTGEGATPGLADTTPDANANYTVDFGMYLPPSLSITKTPNRRRVAVGQNVTWTIRLTNSGPGTSYATVVTDQLPAGLQYVSSTATQGSYNPATHLWTVGDVAANTSPVLTMVTTVLANGPYRNIAIVNGPDDPQLPCENDPTCDDDEIVPDSTADLRIYKRVDKAVANPGEALSYTISVQNIGPADAKQAVLRDPGITGVLENPEYSVDGGAFAAWPATGVVNLPDPIRPNQTVNVVIRGTIPTSLCCRVIENTAQVDSPDDPSGPETSLPVKTCIGVPNVTIEKVVNRNAAIVGDEIVYTLTVRNQGNAPAFTLNVSDAGALVLNNPTFTMSGDATGSGTWTGAQTITTFTGGNFAPNDIITIIIRGTVHPEWQGRVIENIAQVSSPDDPQGVKPSTPVQTAVGTPDLNITKTVDKTAARVGETLTYTIVVRNDGTSAATAVTINDPIASQLDTPTYTLSGDATGTGAWTGTVTPTLTGGTLAAGESITLRITGTVGAAFQGRAIDNVAQATAPNDPTGPVTTPPVQTVIGTADLVAVKRVDKTAAQVGEAIRYTIDVTNVGTSPATQVTITDGGALSLQNPTYTVSGDATGSGNWTGSLTLTTFTAGGLASGESLRIEITGNVTASFQGRVLTNTAQVSSPQDPTGPANTDPVSTVVGTAKITAVKTVNQAAAKPGDVLIYTITVRNEGNSPATSVTINDAQATNLTSPTYNMLGDASGSGTWTGSLTVSTFVAGSLAPGESVVMTIQGTVPASAQGSVVSNVAQVTSPQDPSSPFTTPPVTTTVGAADLSASKAVDKANAKPGDTVTYTIVVRNDGPANATQVTINDQNALALTSPTYTLTGDATGSGAWAGSLTLSGAQFAGNALASGESLTLAITGTVPASAQGTVISNTAQITSPQDPTGPTVTPTVQTAVGTASLSATKSVDKQTAKPGDPLTYTIVVRNNGTAAATQVTVDDGQALALTSPTYAITGDVTASGNWTGSLTVNAAQFLSGGLAQNESFTVTITGTVPASAQSTVLRNVAAVSSPQDPSGPKQTPPVETSVGTARLSATKTVNRQTAKPGDSITYAITVTNIGSATANTVTVDDANALALTNPTYTVVGGTPASGTWTGSLTVTPAAGLTAGENMTVTITGILPQSALGTVLTNTATVSSPQDPTGPVTTAPVQTAVGTADLNATKTVDKTAAQVGDVLTYTITVTNDGNADATSVTVTDAAALQLTSPTFTVSGDASAASAPWTGSATMSTFAGGGLAKGESVVITIRGTVPASLQGRPLDNVATVSSPQDPTGPVTTPVSQTVIGTAKLTVSKQVDRDMAMPGDVLTYTITVNNIGTSPATGVQVTDVLASTLTGATYSVSGGATTAWPATGAITLANPIPAGGSTTVTIRGTVQASQLGKLLENTAQVSSPSDPTGTSNSNPVRTAVGTADLNAMKTVNRTTAQVGDTIVYTITVRNDGMAQATSVNVADAGALQLTSPTYAVSGDASGSGAWTGSLTLSAFTGGHLAPGESATITITGTVPAAALNSAIKNVATITSPQDPTSPVSTQEVTTLVNTADLNASKAVDKTAAKPGDPLTYTLTIRNDGNAAATSVTVNDQAALALTNPTFQITGDVPAPTPSATWPGSVTFTGFTGGGLAPGEQIVVTILGTIPASVQGAALRNTAIISSPQDPSGPTTTNDVSTVVGTAKLVAVKTVDKGAAKPGDQLTYAITIRNEGTANATSITVNDAQALVLTSPQYTLSGDASGSGSWTGSLTLSSFTAGALAIGESVTVQISGLIPQSAQGSVIENVASVVSPQDPSSPVKTDPVTTTVGTAKLTATKTVDKAAAKPGDLLTYTITVRNDGTATANTVTVDDADVMVLTNPTYTLQGDASGNGSWTGSLVVTPNSGLAAGESFMVILRGTVPASSQATMIKNVATVSSPQDPSVPVSTPPVNTNIGTAKLAITKVVNKTAAQVGETLIYTIVVTNDGLANAETVTVNDPQALELNNPTYTLAGKATGSGTWTGSTVVTPIGGLGAGESFTLTISGAITQTSQGKVIKNIASASSPQDPSGPVSSVEVATVINGADLAISKTVDLISAKEKDILTYTLTIRNDGSANANSLTVTDNVALENTSYRINGGASVSPWPGVLNLAAAPMPLVPGGTLTITISGRIPQNATGIIENRAQVSSPDDPTAPVLSNPVQTIIVGENPKLIIDKRLANVVANGNGTYNMTFETVVTNTGDVDLSNFQVMDNLLNTFYNVTTPIVSHGAITNGTVVFSGTTSGTGGTGGFNSGFTGTPSGSINLLGNGATLAEDGTATIRFTVTNVRPSGNGQFSNVATAQGTTPQNETIFAKDDVGFGFGVPSLDVEKQVIEVVDQGNGTFVVTYDVRMMNTGTVRLTNVQMTDDLRAAFPSPIAISSVRTLSADSKAALALNGGFTGTGNNNLLTGGAGSTMDAGAVATIRMVVTLSGLQSIANRGPFTNAVTATATDANGNAVTDNDRALPIYLEDAPVIGVSKVVSAVTGASNGAFDVAYDITVTNLGTVNLENVQITEDLHKTFVAGQTNPVLSYGVQNLTVVSGSLTVNNNFLSNTYVQAINNLVNDTNLLAPGNVLAPGASATVRLVVRVQPSQSNRGPFNNTALATGDSPSGRQTGDTSNNGPVDPDGDGDPNEPGENNTTPVSFESPQIGVAKTVTTVVNNNNGTYDVTYLLNVKNMGQSVLNNVQVTDNLTNAYRVGQTGGASAIQVLGATPVTVVNPATSPTALVANNGFNGTSNINLLSSGRLNPGEGAELMFTVRVTPGGNLGPFTNTATGTGRGPNGTTTTDVSNYNPTDPTNPDPDGDGDPTNNNNGTPVSFNERPVIGIAKQVVSVVGPAQDATIPSGQYKVTYDLLIKNLGDVDLKTVQITDDLKETFVGALLQPVLSYRVTSATVTQQPTGGALTLNNAFASNAYNQATNTLTNDIRLLTAASSTLPKGTTGIVRIVVQVQPSASFTGPFTNSAMASAQGPGGTPTADVSDAGTEPDPNNNGNPFESGENDPTPVSFEFPLIGVAKDLTNTKLNPDNTTDITFTIVVKNYGRVVLNNVQITDDLSKTFGAALVSVVSAPKSLGGVLATNAAFNGTTNQNLLAANQRLNPGQSDQIQLTVRINPPLSPAPYYNTAIVTGTSPTGTPVRDESVMGKDPDPDGNGDPTDNTMPTEIRMSTDIRVMKMADKPNPEVGENVLFTITVDNQGPYPATNVKISDVLPQGLQYQIHQTSQGTFDRNTGIWTVGNLKVSEGATMELTATLTTPLSVVNTACLHSFDQSDPDASNNCGKAVIVPKKMADLSITKTVDQNRPVIGSTIEYTLTVTNKGPAIATGIKVTDQLQPNLQYVSHTYGDATDTYDPSTGIWNIGNLTVGQNATLKIKAQVLQGPVVTNIATISKLDQIDPDPTDNQAIVTIAVGSPQVDIVLVKRANGQTSATVNQNEEVTFQITMTNQGPDDANNVIVKELLPAGIKYTNGSATASAGTYDEAAREWSVNILPANQTVTLTFKGKAEVKGTVANAVQLISVNEFDRNPSNNYASAIVCVECGSRIADLKITKTVDEQIPALGDDITFTIQLYNAGPNTATNVAVTDLLPSGVSFISSSDATYNPVGGDNVWNVASLPIDGKATLTVKAKVTGMNPMVNFASVTGMDQRDDTQNVASVTVTPRMMTPRTGADLRATKAVSNAAPRVGDDISFTITVYNDGPENATNVRVKDPLPQGTTLVSTSGAGTYDAATGLWTLGTINSGSQAQVEMVVKVGQQGFRENGINAFADNQDPNPLNNGNYAAWCADCGAIDPADLVLTKAVSNAVPKVGETITFTLTLKNNGPNKATGVVVRDLFPPSLQFVPSSVQVSSSDLNSAGNFDGLNWNAGILDPGTQMTLKFDVLVTKDLAVANVAIVAKSNMPDPTPGYAIVAITPQPSAGLADLSITKTVSEQTPMQGGEVTFTIRVTNNGPSTATNLKVRDQLPVGLTYISDDDAASYNPNAGDFLWNVGTLDVGASKELKIRVAVAAGANIVNTATVESMDQTDPNGPASGSVTVKPIVMMPGADMTIDMTSAPTPATSPGTYKYIYTARNIGSVAAQGVTFTTVLPNGVTFKPSTVTPATEWACSNSGQVVSCIYLPGNFNPGMTRFASFDVDVAPGLAGGTNLFANVVVNATNDTNAANNYDTETTVVGAPASGADMTIAVSDAPDVVSPGGNLIYTFFASNVGTQPAQGVSFTTTLPSGVTYVPGSANGADWNCVQDGQKLTCTYKGTDFAPATTSVVTINTTVSGSVPNGTTLTNVTTVSATRDDNPANNNAVEVTYVGSVPNSADMVIVKEGSAQQVNAPGSLTYFFSVHNVGNQPATGVSFTDLLPAGMTFAIGSVKPAAEWNCSVNAQVVTCSFTPGTMGANTSRYMSFDVNVAGGLAQGTQLKNTVTVAAANDGNSANNTSEDVVTVGSVSSSSLAITKTGPAEVSANSVLSYTVSVRNTGNTTLSNVAVRDIAVNGNLTNVTYSLDGIAYQAWPSAGSITLPGVLNAGESRNLSLRGTAPASGIVLNTAYASATGVAEVASNTVSTTVTAQQNPGFDVAVSKTVDKATPNAGEMVTYTITVRNVGAGTATNVVVNDKLPTGLSYLPFGSSAEYNAATGTWNVGTLTSGQSRTITVKATVNANATESIVNVATVACGNSAQVCADDNLANNVAAAIISPVPCTPAHQGGVESNGSRIIQLATALFDWNVKKAERLQTNVIKNIVTFAGPVATAAEAIKDAMSPPDGLEVFFPTSGPENATSVTSTPEGILNPYVSNANAVYGMDYSTGNRRIAAGIATQTSAAVYQHSKQTCDRLAGSSLASVTTMTINGNNFITTKLNRDGMTDCAISFVAYKTATGYVIDSRFTLPEYKIPSGATNVLNFQLWGTAPQYAEYLVKEVLNKLQQDGGSITYLNGGATAPVVPNVFVKSATYENGGLTLVIENGAGASSLRLKGAVTRNEGGAAEQKDWTLSLNPSQTTQTVVVPTGNVFDVQLEVSNTTNADRDQVYMQDGIWAHNPNGGTVSFAVTPQPNIVELRGYKTLERSARISGQTSGVSGSDFVSLSRYFKPGWGRQVLNAAPGSPTGQYDQIEFFAQGTGTVEVAIKKKSTDWNDLFRTTITLTPTGRVQRFFFTQFKRTAGGTLLPDDLESIVFYVKGSGTGRTSFDLNIRDLRLRNSFVPNDGETELPSEINLGQNYPNPFNPTTTLSFDLPAANKVLIEVYDVLGRKVSEVAKGQFTAGHHEVLFDASSLSSGTYIYRLKVGDKVITKKMTLLK